MSRSSIPLAERPLAVPFVVLIDAQEKAPFNFAELGLRADSDRQYRSLEIQTDWKSLGVGMGDYSIQGHEPSRSHNPENPRVSVERKSVEDCIGTVLGFGSDRRRRFEEELANLQELESSCVIVEGTIGRCISTILQGEFDGKKTPQQNAKTWYRSILALQQDYRVPWFFCDDRRLAGTTAFRWLERFWKKLK